MSKDAAKLRSLIEVLDNQQISLKATRDLTELIFPLLVLRTPVDSGRARAHWSVLVGGSVGLVSDKTDKSGGATIDTGLGALASLTRPTRVRLVNPLPYINRLEKGWSQQAPSGWIRLTATEARAFAFHYYRQAARSFTQ
jgi:hypothetical protein